MCDTFTPIYEGVHTPSLIAQLVERQTVNLNVDGCCLKRPWRNHLRELHFSSAGLHLRVRRACACALRVTEGTIAHGCAATATKAADSLDG